MNARILLVSLALFGCDQPRPAGPSIGETGVLFDRDPAENVVMIYNPSFHHGMDAVPVGTRATYLGPAPRVDPFPDSMIKVSIREGLKEGAVGSISAANFRPLPR